MADDCGFVFMDIFLAVCCFLELLVVALFSSNGKMGVQASSPASIDAAPDDETLKHALSLLLSVSLLSTSAET